MSDEPEWHSEEWVRGHEEHYLVDSSDLFIYRADDDEWWVYNDVEDTKKNSDPPSEDMILARCQTLTAAKVAYVMLLPQYRKGDDG